MSADASPATPIHLAPVAGRSRIDLLDVIRGIAILGIFYLNIGAQAGSGAAIYSFDGPIRWTFADRQSAFWTFALLDGTQRGLLQLLFGAGMMLLTSRAMEPDGPVAVADLYYRRTLWLLAFGLFDVFAIMWEGDILTVYATAALFLFPFRRLKPKWLLALASIYLVYYTAVMVPPLLDSVRHDQQLSVATAHQKAGQPLTAADRKALDEQRQEAEAKKNPPADVKARRAAEAKAHAGSWLDYAQWQWGNWKRIASRWFITWVAEALATMMIGVALWKWGILQGQKSARFYAIMAIASYAIAAPFRVIDAQSVLIPGTLQNLAFCVYEFGRLPMTLGHLALINLVMKSGVGVRILSPFRAAGRTAFSLYFLEQIIGIHILFSPYGLNLWNHVGWFDMTMIASAMFFGLLIVANIWSRFFVAGPLEWAWRSLSYLELQPFRRRAHKG